MSELVDPSYLLKILGFAALCQIGTIAHSFMKRFKENKYYLFASLLIIITTIFIYKGVSNLNFATQKKNVITTVYTVPIKQIPILKENLEKTNLDSTSLSYEVFAQSISAKSAYVEDIDTGTVLFDRNSERILLPASTTKLMTALVAIDEYDLDDTIKVPELPHIDGFNYEFRIDEEIRVRDLLKAALIQSNNDAAYVLALASKDGIDGYIEKMNAKAQELNLKSTKYENPAGFDDDTQKSSAHDLVILSKEFMSNEFLASVVGTKETTFTDVTGENTHKFYTTHQLLGIDPTVVGIKTGTTQGASQVLITQFNRDGHNIVVVVMGSDERYLETTKLVDWVFNAYTWIDPEELI